MIRLRGGRCELCGSDYELQIDHCFSRKVKEIFYDEANLTVLCRACHFQKSYHIKARDLDVYGRVIQREGQKEFNRLKDIAKLNGPYPDFNKRWYLESKIEEMIHGEKQELDSEGNQEPGSVA